MKRRNFVKNSMLMGTVAAVGNPSLFNPEKINEKHNFNLKYAPHLGMFDNLAGKDYIDQLTFAADQGFTAWEDNGMKKRPVALQEKIAQTMSDLDMTMGVFVAHTIYWKEPSLVTGKQETNEQFLKEIDESIEVAKRVDAKWMTVVPGHIDLGLEMDYQTANIIDILRRASEKLEKHNLVMVLEPLNWWANHPGLFLSKIPQAYMICKAVNSPSCKILFDIYHQQITEGNLIPNIDKAWDEIGYFQTGDNPGRKEPTTGEINYKNVFKHIYNKGWKGVLGMEHGNSMPGEEGERAVIEAYASVDDFK